MREQMQAQLEALKKELETGQVELQKVESQRTHLHETMLRISGAMQVLEELLAEGHSLGHDGATGPSKTQPTTVRANGEAD